MKDKKDWIFECKKCQHNLYVSDEKLNKLLDTECPECGEEPVSLWILIGKGLLKDTCDHNCTSVCRHDGCNCVCGEWHGDKE